MNDIIKERRQGFNYRTTKKSKKRYFSHLRTGMKAMPQYPGAGGNWIYV